MDRHLNGKVNGLVFQRGDNLFNQIFMSMNDGVSLFSFVFASCENTMAANSKCSVIPESRRKALSLLFFFGLAP